MWNKLRIFNMCVYVFFASFFLLRNRFVDGQNWWKLYFTEFGAAIYFPAIQWVLFSIVAAPVASLILTNFHFSLYQPEMCAWDWIDHMPYKCYNWNFSCILLCGFRELKSKSFYETKGKYIYKFIDRWWYMSAYIRSNSKRE